MRALSVVASSRDVHTDHMARGVRTSTFITGADGFIGTELRTVLVAGGHQLFGLTASVQAAERVRRAGGVTVRDDLLAEGHRQDEAEADSILHVPPQPVRAWCITRRRAGSVARAHVLMDPHLRDAAAAGPTRRIVFVADASCYGATGPLNHNGRTASALEHGLAPAPERLDRYVAAGVPIVTAFPGLVYGSASWFREPVMTGRRVLQGGKTGSFESATHVHDCAFVHPAERR